MINIREEEMKELVRFRATPSDKAQIKAAASKLGLNSSALIRMTLINNGIIKV